MTAARPGTITFVNITIVGAGIVGCAVAHELASRGARVHVVDMRGTGLGATQASAGILAPYVEGHLDALLRSSASAARRCTTRSSNR